MDRFDVAVVGAGPAGSRAAWRLARGGARRFCAILRARDANAMFYANAKP
jgi:flavin-dependent dehydrogenase